MNDDPRTPFFEELLERAAAASTYGLRVMLPARVESYDATKHRCSATPLIMDGDVNEGGDFVAVALPQLHDIPVAFPGGGGVRMKWPIVKGDEVLLVFSSSSIARFKSLGSRRGPVDPGDDRRHDLNDAYAIPTFKVTDPSDASAMIEFTSGGLIKAGGDEPLVKRSEFLGHTHATAGNGPPSPPTAISPAGSAATFPGTSKLRG